MKLSRGVAIAFACNMHYQFANAVGLIRAKEGTSIANNYNVTLEDDRISLSMSQDEITITTQRRTESVTANAEGGLTLADSTSNNILNSEAGTSNRTPVLGGSRKKQFTSKSEVQGQVRIYCRDPANYDTTEYGPMEDWDVSRVTSMYKVFDMYYNRKYNTCDIPDISTWDVSQVTDFRSVFRFATSFNQNIGNWNTSKGTQFAHMFYKATSFNQNIGNWDISEGTYFPMMFYESTSFNQNIGDWDVSNGTHFTFMFYKAISFNQNIGNWDVSKGKYFAYMLYEASAFEQNLNIWLKWVYNAPGGYTKWCDRAVCNQGITFAPTKSPLPTKSPSATPSNAPTLSIVCRGKKKMACKKVTDSCVFGTKKIFGACKPKKPYKHNCADYDDKESCAADENHGGLCNFNNDGCFHVCNDLKKKRCLNIKNMKDNKKTCYATKVKNPCKGCQLKTTCG